MQGWNLDPTPFEWGGKRAARRQRSHARRYPLGGLGAYVRCPILRKKNYSRNGKSHANQTTPLAFDSDSLAKATLPCTQEGANQ